MNLKFFCISLLFLLFSENIFSQTGSYRDSMETLYAMKGDSLPPAFFVEMCKSLIPSDSTRAVFFINKAYERAEESSNEYMEAYFLRNLISRRYKGEKEKYARIYQFTDSLMRRIAQMPIDSNLVEPLIQLAESVKKYNYGRSSEILKNALGISETSNNKKRLADINFKLGEIFLYELKENRIGYSYILQSIRNYLNSGIPDSALKAFGIITDAGYYYNQKLFSFQDKMLFPNVEFDSIQLEFCYKGLQIIEAYDDTLLTINAYEFAIDYFRNLGKLDTCLLYLDYANDLSREMAESRNRLANYYEGDTNFQARQALGTEVIFEKHHKNQKSKIAELNKDAQIRNLLLKQKSLEERRKEDAIRILSQEKSIQQLKLNKLDQQIARQKLLDLQNRHRIDSLSVSNQLKALETSRQKQIKNYSFIGLALLAIFSLILSWFIIQRQYDNKKLRETLTNLKATQDQLIHQEKMASLGQLTNGIAHEIKNPLNFIIIVRLKCMGFWLDT